MNVKVTDYDAVDYIDNPELAIEVIKSAFEDGDPRIIRMSVSDVARAIGMGKIAGKANVGRQSLYKSLSEDGNPSFETMLKVLDSLGLKMTVEQSNAA